MKKIMLLIAAALILSPAANAQMPVAPFKIDKYSLLKEIERSDKAIENEKRAAKGLTWLERGDAFYKISASVAAQIYAGMGSKDFYNKIGKNFETSEKTVQNETYTVVSIPEVDIYLLDEVVQFWIEKDVIYEGATDKAVEAYKKAAELDKKLTPKAKDGLVRTADIFKMNANTHYHMGETIPAAEDYYKAYQVLKDPLVGQIDSISIYYAGYLYMSEDKFDRAIEILEEAANQEIWEEGRVAYFLSWAYLQSGEEYYPKAKEILIKGSEMFPENENIVEGLINYYSMTQSDFSEITKQLEAAIKQDPSKINYWSALTQAYAKVEDREMVIDFLRKFLQRFPDEFTPNYFLGDELMEKGERLINEAETSTSLSQGQKDELMAQSISVFNEALPLLMKAYNEKPTEPATLQRVTRVLFNLKDEPGRMEEFEKFFELEKEMLGRK